MKKILVGIILTTFIAVSSCGSDDDKPEEAFIEPEVITLEATEITEVSARLAAFFVSEGSVTQPVDRLICWSFNTNPTVDDNVGFVDGSGTGEYFVNVNNLLQNTTYNVRAAIVYINNEGHQHVVYGNNVSFTTMDETVEDPVVHVESSAPTHITSRKVTLNATVFDSEQNLGSRGFTVSKNENPTIGSGASQSGGTGAGAYSVEIENLEPNTIYYARPYVHVNSIVRYGEQVSFTTPGYLGPAGGRVVYDKGIESDGWRYLEAYLVDMSIERTWGCPNSTIQNTLPDIGKGKENTQLIVSGCADSDCAARYCNNLTHNGFSDWFLGSLRETEVAFTTLYDVGIHPADAWTSTQWPSSFEYAYSVYLNNGNAQNIELPKFYHQHLLAMRRY